MRHFETHFIFAGTVIINSKTLMSNVSSYGQFRRYLKNHLFGIWAIKAQCDAWFSALYKYYFFLTYLLNVYEKKIAACPPTEDHHHIIHAYADDHAISSCGYLKYASRTLIITDHGRLRLKLNTVIRPPDVSREILCFAVELVDSYLPNGRSAPLQKYISSCVSDLAQKWLLRHFALPSRPCQKLRNLSSLRRSNFKTSNVSEI